MRLLSPQTVAQQTNHSSYGFYAKGNFGTFTFSGYHKMMCYYSNNNFTIFFIVPVLISTSIPTSYLSMESTELHDNLSPLQVKLPLKHQKMGHLNMSKIQHLAKNAFLEHLTNRSPREVLHYAKPACMESNTSAHYLPLPFNH
jgi:hypothetical protein